MVCYQATNGTRMYLSVRYEIRLAGLFVNARLYKLFHRIILILDRYVTSLSTSRWVHEPTIEIGISTSIVLIYSFSSCGILCSTYLRT